MVSRWELGFNVPSLYYAEKLAAYFGVSLGALMGREDEEKPAADPGELADGVRARLRLLSFFMFAPALLYALLAAEYISAAAYMALWAAIFAAVSMAFDAWFKKHGDEKYEFLA